MSGTVLVRTLAAIGALALLWLLMLGAVAAYDAMSDGGMMDGMGDMQGMMDGMMGGDQEVTTGSANGRGEVTIRDFRFEPTQLTVTVGTVVAWTNADRAPHTATARDATFDSERLDGRESFEMAFNSPGTFTYFCTYHPWMEATIIAR